MQDYLERSERRQSLTGKVVSNKMFRTVVIEVEREKLHRKYNKVISLKKKVMAHDPDNIGNIGDLVRIIPCRPISKRKRHVLKDVVLQTTDNEQTNK